MSKKTAQREIVDAELLARLAKLGIRVRQAMEGALTGAHRSPHHGSSVEFAQHREYTPGDEIKDIDWKAFGKTDRHYVKQYEDETNLRTYVLLDTSGSMDYAGARAVDRKLDYAAKMAAALAWLLLRQGDAVGLLTFGAKVGTFVPPRARGDHFWNLARVMGATPVGGPTDAVAALERVAEVAARRSLIVLLSDCFDFTHDDGRLAAVARQLRRRGHQVAVFQVLDPDEVDFPFKDLTLFEDLEVDERLLADPRGMRAQYLEEVAQYCERLQHDLTDGGVRYWRVNTATPIEQAITDALRGPL